MFSGKLDGAWRADSAGLTHVVFYGDSLLQSFSATPPGASMGPPDRLRARWREERPVHTGFCGGWVSNPCSPSGHWTFAGEWRTGTPTPAPHMNPLFGRSVWRGTNADSVATWRPGDGETVTAFHLVYVDGPAEGAAAVSYSIDGGPWVDLPLDRPEMPVLVRHPVPLAVNASVAVRSADAAGTAVAFDGLVGLEARAGDSGLVVHNLGRGLTLAVSALDIVPTTILGVPHFRPWASWFDQVRPKLTFVSFSNDAAMAIHEDDQHLRWSLQGVGETLTNLGSEVVFVVPPIQDPGHSGRPERSVRAMNRAYRDVAAGLGLGCIDLASGWGSFADSLANGRFATADGLHPTSDGNEAMTVAFDRYLRHHV